MGKRLTEKSHALYQQAQHYLPGGVNSPVRAFGAVGSEPFIVTRAAGARLYDVDGNEYIDYVCSWGPLILGHAHPAVVDAVATTAARGTSFGATCELEIELARLICEAIPSVERVRLVNSGTEAAMSAVRLARAFTEKNTIVKFEGCYHGHADSFLIKAGSGALTTGIPTSPGVPEALAVHTLVARYNDSDSVAQLFDRAGHDIAAIIVEPVAANMGLVLPRPGFLNTLRSIADAYNCLLIFDEVITGFRIRYGAYQDSIGVQPDLTVLGKIIGGGLPVGAYGGRQEIMDSVAPVGPVYQAGTLSGNPLAMAAGIATLRVLQTSQFYELLEQRTTMLVDGMRSILKKKGMPWRLNVIGSMFSLFCTEHDVVDYAAVMTSDPQQFARFHRNLVHHGVFFPPSPFETCFVSSRHTPQDIELTLHAVEQALEA